MVIHLVCCFNLLQGPAAVKFDSTKVGETDTRQPPFMQNRLCVSWWNRSHVRGHVRLVQAASSHDTTESK